MDTSTLARGLVAMGLVLVALGGLFWAGGRLGLGRLPGDVVVRGEHSTFYFPVVTCLLLSVGLSLLGWLWRAVAR